MYDMLPFPHITATKAEEQVSQINNYLIQLKETLEFILMNISSENLSPELNNLLRELGADIKAKTEEQNNQIQQVAQKKSLTVSDVINSTPFKSAITSVEEQIPKAYLSSIVEEVGETTTTYTFTDADGKSVVITVANAT